MAEGLNTYRKFADGSWGVAVWIGPHAVAGTAPKSGDVVKVTLRNGTVKEETLGEYVGNGDGNMAFRIVPKAFERKSEQVGNLAAVFELFAKAKAHLKYPKIVLAITENGAVIETIRINVAGDRAKVPGSLNVVSLDKLDNMGRKLWYGRIHTDGRFEQSRGGSAKIVDKLRAFANAPAEVAAADGKLTGNCSFCHLPLSDERSTAVGYGATCAKHWHMPWGARPEEFAGKAA
jgi:hypothetical protein